MTTTRKRIRIVESTPDERASALAERAAWQRNADIWNEDLERICAGAPPDHNLVVIYGRGQVRYFEDPRMRREFLQSLEPALQACAVRRIIQDPRVSYCHTPFAE